MSTKNLTAWRKIYQHVCNPKDKKEKGDSKDSVGIVSANLMLLNHQISATAMKTMLSQKGISGMCQNIIARI